MKKYEEIKILNAVELFKAVLTGDIYINIPSPVTGQPLKCRLYFDENALHYDCGAYQGRVLTPMIDNISSIVFYQESKPTLSDYLAIKPRLCKVWDNGEDKAVNRIRLITKCLDGKYKHSDLEIWYENAEMLTDEEIIQYLENPISSQKDCLKCQDV